MRKLIALLFCCFCFCSVTQDDNHDGIFTVDELLRWIDEHRLVKFVEEGMDVDLDELVPSENASASKDSSESTTSSTSPTSKK